MFAYCNNNPIFYIDTSGELAYPGEIHNQVVYYIATKHGFYSEQKIEYSVGFGRADLISLDGQVWEVKPLHIAVTSKGALRPAVVSQINRYVRNIWKNFPNTMLRIGGAIPSGSFTYISGLATYKVEYKYCGNGVIGYTYTREIDWEPVKETVAITAVMVGFVITTISGFIYGIPPQNVPIFGK